MQVRGLHSWPALRVHVWAVAGEPARAPLRAASGRKRLRRRARCAFCGARPAGRVRGGYAPLYAGVLPSSVSLPVPRN